MIPIRGLRAPVRSRPEPEQPLVRRDDRVFWTPALDDKLAELWEAGLSGGAIAKEMGPRFTSNSVIGRANRIGLRRRLNPIKLPGAYHGALR